MDVRLGLFVLALAVGGALSSPIQTSRTCAQRQCTPNNKFRYRTGQTYQYKYEGSVATKVNGASEGSAGMHVSAIAHIEVITSCEYALKLTNVGITEVDSQGRHHRLFGTELFTRSLEAAPLRFAFHDGLIEEVCPVPGEKPWITNIKRGVLSSFQNSMESLTSPTARDETDITGNCMADYRIAERGYTSVTVDRRKDLIGCTNRHGYKTAFQSTPYRVNSNIQSLPLTKSSHNCRQTIHNSGYLSQVECREHHVFRPFSKDNNGAITEASHKMVFQSQQRGVTTSLGSQIRRSSLLFEHEGERQTQMESDAATRDILKQICQNAAHDVRPETPKLFSELVYKMKQLDTPSLRNLHRAVNSGQVCRVNANAAKKAFMDAVPMTGTVSSVSLISELIRTNQVRDSEADMWLTSLAFIQEPRLEMIRTIKELLSSGIQNQRNYLSTSALIHNYCRHNGRCQTEIAVQEVVQMLESKLNSNCRVSNPRDEDKMLMVLKALGNIGVATDASQTLGRCAAEQGNSIEIRLAALEALRNQPCEAQREPALRLLADREQSDEIRIASYLAAMKCASSDVINKIQRILESESANQVGSFIWTHLTNLMETDDPHKAEIKNILNSVYLQKEFDKDRRKFSRNYEASVFLDSINTGAKVESNVIWSRKSFVPRSGMFNLTVDLFGQSVNLLEVGGRVEGMEQLLETFFGPNGYFPEKTVMNTLRREKRQVANQKLNNVDKTYNAKANLDNIKGNMYFKIFGSEVGYFDLLNLRSASEFNILDILIKLAQQQKVEFNKSVMFLDTSITIPTLVGLPLKLSVNGTASINIGLRGKMDVRRAHPSPRTVDIDGNVKSSAAVQIVSMMSVDANVAQTGLKMISTMHSSTEMDGKWQIQNSQIMTVNINMPRDKQELFSIDNKFYTIHQSEEREQLMPGNERVEDRKCTGDRLVKLLGVELCGEISYPLAGNVRTAPFYPLTGPSRMALVLNKRDTHSAYQFEAKMLNEKVRRDGHTMHKRTARLAFNTPGSQTDRNLLFDFVLDQPEKAMKLQVVTPWKQLGLEGSLVNEPAMKRANLRLNLDDETEYSMRAEVQVDEKPQGKVFYPNVNIKLPQRDPIQLTGNVAFKHPSSVSFNLRLVDLFTTPVKVSGSTTYDPSVSRLNTDLKLQCPLIDLTGEGYFEMNPDNHRSRFSLKYQRPSRPEESVILHYKLRNTQTPSLSKISVDTSIRNTIWPEYNNKLKWELQKTASHAEMTFDFHHGHNMDDQRRRVQASIITNYQVAMTRSEVDAIVSFSYPAQNLDFTTRLDHRHHPRMLSSKATITYGEDQNAEIQLGLNNLSTDKLRGSSSFRLKYPGREIIYRQSLDERQRHEYHHSLMVQWQEGRVFRTQDMAKKDGNAYSLTSVINIPDLAPISFKSSVSYSHEDEKKAMVILSVEHGSRKYAIRGGYVVNVGEIININGHFAGSMPQRGLDAKFTVYHDHERTNFGVTTEWSKQGEPKKVSVKIVARRKMYPDMDISGSAELTTPFAPVEKIGARFQYTAQSQQHNVNVGVTWAPHKTISLEGSGRLVDWRDFQLSAAVNTPFNGYQRLSSNVRSRIHNSELALAINGQKASERVDLELSAQWREKFAGGFKFRLPNVAHSLEGSFSHAKEGANGHLVQINAVWNEQAFGAIIKGKANNLADVEASLTVNTPIPGYQKSTAMYKHLFQSGKAIASAEGAFAGQRSKLGFTIEDNSGYSTRDIKFQAEVVTPWRHLRIGKTTLRFFNNGARFSSEAEFVYNDAVVGYEVTMNNNYARKMSNGLLKISTPIRGYQRMVYTWTHRLTNNVLSTNEFQINGLKYVVNVNGNHDINSRSHLVIGELTIATPHSEMRNSVFNMRYENNAQKLLTSATLTVDGNTAAFSLDATGSYRQQLVCNFNLNLEPLLERYMQFSLKPVTASMTFNGRAQPVNIVSFIRYGENKRIAMEGGFSYLGPDYMNGNVAITTPYEKMRHVRIQTRHERRNNRYESQHTITLNQNQAISLKGNLNHENTISGDVELTTPWDILRKIRFEANHEKQYGEHFVHVNKLLVQFMGTEIAFDSGATYQGHRHVHAFAKLNTPFEGYRQMGYAFRTRHNDGRRVNTFELETAPNKKSEVSLTYSLSPLDMTIGIKTPCHHLTSFQAKVGHSGSPLQFRTTASFDIVSYSLPMSGSAVVNVQSLNDINVRITSTNNMLITLTHQKTGTVYTTKARGEFRGQTINLESTVNADEKTLDVSLTTPFALSNMALNVNCRMPAEMLCTARSEMTYNAVSHAVQVRVTPGKRVGMVTAMYSNTDGTKVDTKFSYYSRREQGIYKAGIHASLNEKPLGLDFELQREPIYMTKLVVKTPFEGHAQSNFYAMLDHVPGQKLVFKVDSQTTFYLLKGLKIEYDHRGSWTEFEDKSTFEYDASYSRIFYTDEWKVRGLDMIEASGRLVTPFKMAEYISYTVRHNRVQDVYETNLSLEYSPGRRAVLENKLSLAEGLRLTTSLKAPLPKFRSFTFNLNHRGDFQRFSQIMSVNYNDAYAVSSDVDVRSYVPVRATVQVNRPGAEPVIATMTQTRLGDGFHHNTNVDLGNGRKMKLVGTIAAREQSLKASVDIETPFAILPSLKSSLEYGSRPVKVVFTTNVRTSKGPMDMNLKFDMTEPENVILTAKTEFAFGTYSVNYNHELVKRPIALTANLNIGIPQGEFATSFKMNARPHASDMEFTLSTPFEQLRNLVYKNEQQTPEKYRMNQKQTLTYNSKQVWRREVILRGLEDMTYEEDHPYYANRVSSKLLNGIRTTKWSTTWPGQPSGVRLENSYRVENPLITFKLQTPWRYVRDMTIELEGSTTSEYKLTGETRFAIQHNMMAGPVSGILKWNVPARTAEMSVRTPYEGYENMGLNLHCSSSGRGSSYRLSAGAKLLRHSSEMITTSLDVTPNALTMRATTPFEGYRNLALKAEYANDQILNGKFAVEWDSKKIESGMSLVNQPERVHFKLSLKTPFTPMESTVFELTHNMNGASFNNFVRLEYNNGQEMKSNGKFVFTDSSRPKVDFTAKLETPYQVMRKTEFQFKHEGDVRRQFTCFAEAKYLDSNVVSANLEFENGASTKGSLTVKTPFTGFETQSVSFEHRGQGRQFSTQTKFVCARGRAAGFKVEASLLGRQNTRMTATVFTPVAGLEQMTVMVDHSMTRQGLRTSLTYSDITNGRYHAHAEARRATKSATVTIGCPKGHLLMTLSGDLRRCNFKVKAAPTSQSQESWVDLSFDNNDNMKDISGKVALSIPNVVRTSSEMKLKMSPVNFDLQVSGFRCAGQVTVKTDRAIVSARWPRGHQKVELNWSAEERIYGGIKISGTVPRMELIAASVSHYFDGSNRLSTGVNVHWSPVHRVTGTVTYERAGPRTAANIVVATPFENYRNMQTGAEFNGNKLKFTTGAYVQYMTDKRVDLTVKYDHKRTGEIIVKSPCPHYPEVKASFEKVRVGDKEGYTTMVQWAPREAVTVKLVGKHSGFPARPNFDGFLEIKTPIADVGDLLIETSQRMNSHDLSTTLKVRYNHDQVFNTLFTLMYHDAVINGALTMYRPHPMKVSLGLNMTPQGKTGELEFIWNMAQPQNKFKITGRRMLTGNRRYSTVSEHSLKVQLPGRTMEIKNEHSQSSAEEKLQSSFTWDQERNKEIVFKVEKKDTSRGYRGKAWEATAELVTPIRTLKAGASHSDNGRRYTADGHFEWDAIRAPEKRISFVSVADIAEDNCAIEVTIRPPRTHEIKLRHEAKYNTGEIVFSTLNTLSYSPREDETLTLRHDVRNARVGRHLNYSTSFEVSHPASSIKVNGIGHFGSSYRSQTAGLKLGYMKADRQMSEVHLLGEIDSVSNSAKIIASTPFQRLDTTGRLTQDRYGYKVEQDIILNGERAWWSFDLNKRNKSMAYNLHYDPAQPSKAFMIVGWYQPTEVVLKALHQSSAGTETWGLASANLNSSRVLHTRLHWEPRLIPEFKEKTEEKWVDVKQALTREMNEVQRALNTEAEGRRSLLTTPDTTELAEAVTAEIESFKTDYQTALNELTRMVERNEFYLADASSMALTTLETGSEYVRGLSLKIRRELANYKRMALQKIAAIRRTMDRFMGKFEEKIAAIVLKFRPAWQSYAYSMIRGVQNTHQKMTHTWEQFTEDMAERHEAFTGYFDERFGSFSEKMDNFIRQWRSLPDHVLSTEEKNFFAKMQEKLEILVEKIRTRFDTLYTRFHDDILLLRDRITHKINQVTEELMKYRSTRVLVNYARQVYYHALDVWDAWEVPETVAHVAKTLYKETRKYLKEYISRAMKKYMRVENSGFTVFDPANGEIRAAIFLPLEIDQFDQLPEINLERAKQALYKLKDKWLPESDYSIWDTYYKYKPSSNPLDWIPPFKAHAMIAHGRHYTTFDGAHYDFASAGTCSYVLARDFIDGNFTVVANYRNGQIHSMMVMTNGKNVEIFDDFKVTVDDHRKELPIEFDNTTVTRHGHKIRIDNEKGVTVTCDLYNKICTTNVTGWYFGKTAGLFGTYNNEQDDEFLTASRRTTTDLNEFTRSWEIGHHCSSPHNVARRNPETTNPEIRQICENYFKNKHSVFRPCYKQVDPEKYLEICISDLQRTYDSRSLREKACSVGAAYRQECSLIGVNMAQDSGCISCSRPDGGSYRGSVTLDNNRYQKKADIVLIVEEKPCNRDVVSRLERIVSVIDNSLKTKGIRDSRFAIYGFGGRGVHNHVHPHTMEGQIFNRARKVPAAIRSLDFSGVGSNEDVLGAVYDVSKLSYRAGASKNVILIPCSDCESVSIDYAALNQILIENSLNLHVMADHDFALRINSPKTNYLFGIDNSAAYTMYHVNQRDLSGDVHLHRQVVMPKTLCGALALSQNGSFFNVQKLTEGRSKAQKSFVDVFARRVVKSAIPQECQVCDCVQDQDGVGKSVCRSCAMTSYNSFFKRIFPSMYNHAPTDAYRGAKAERIPEPIPAPRQLVYE